MEFLRGFSKWAFLTSAVIIAACLVWIAVNDRPLGRGQALLVPVDDSPGLHATYYPGRLPAGVLLLEGFGSDQVTLRSIAVEFARQGLHVFTFDFSGHGRSRGGLTFDNAATDRLARQTLAAQGVFQNQSGLPPDQIVWLGHSLGARVALQAATMSQQQPAGLILVGAQVNLVTNPQAEFFTGTNDDTLAWVHALGPRNPPTNIVLLSGEWDDILTLPSGAELMHRLTGGAVAGSLQPYGDLNQGSYRRWITFPGLFHNYEVFSTRVIQTALAETSRMVHLSPALPASASTAGMRVIAWILAFSAMLVLLVAANQPTRNASPPAGLPPQMRVHNLRRLLVGKAVLWLPALPVAALVAGLAFIVPLPRPVFNLIYVGFIGGYGLLLLLLYRLGKIPGVTGRLTLHPNPHPPSASQWGLALSFNAALFAFTIFFARSGWFFTPPVNERLVWLLVFTPLTMLGFWMGQVENDLIRSAAPGQKKPLWIAAGIGLLPFLIWTSLLAGLGSISGMIGGFQGLLVLVVVLLHGQITRRITGLRWPAALAQSLLLYLWILPQGVLFL